MATSGAFFVRGLPIVVPQANLSLSKDDYLRGHFEFEFPLTKDFTVAGDISHDFQTVGGFREDFGAEIRLTKFFFPQPPARPALVTK